MHQPLPRERRRLAIARRESFSFDRRKAGMGYVVRLILIGCGILFLTWYGHHGGSLPWRLNQKEISFYADTHALVVLASEGGMVTKAVAIGIDDSAPTLALEDIRFSQNFALVSSGTLNVLGSPLLPKAPYSWIRLDASSPPWSLPSPDWPQPLDAHGSTTVSELRLTAVPGSTATFLLEIWGIRTLLVLMNDSAQPAELYSEEADVLFCATRSDSVALGLRNLLRPLHTVVVGPPVPPSLPPNVSWLHSHLPFCRFRVGGNRRIDLEKP